MSVVKFASNEERRYDIDSTSPRSTWVADDHVVTRQERALTAPVELPIEAAD